ncbi:methyltransferase [Kineococcus sp. NUM-3379]
MRAAGRELHLRRYPDSPRELLRAFDAADELLVDHVLGAPGVEEDTGLPAGVALGAPVVLLGDRWGALATALAPAAGEGVGGELLSVTDSAAARAAARANCELNGRAVPILLPATAAPERVGALLVRLPRTQALLEELLLRVRPLLGPGTPVVAAGMVKEVHTSTLEVFSRLLGPVRTSRARRKARLLVCTPQVEVVRAPQPAAWPQRWAVEEAAGPLAGVEVVQHAGVFSAGRLDVGTRLLVDTLLARRSFAAGERVLDLGCGNGLVGLAVARAQPGVRLTFVDDSDLAVASARATVGAGAPSVAASFLVGDSAFAATSGAELEPGSQDVVLLNPPFHVHSAVTGSTALRMFRDARAVLRPGGELWVVVNRHLGHHVPLRRMFASCEAVAGHPKFVVLRAVRG